MAVVFISPKQRQKVFFMGITAAVLLFLVAVSLIVFLSQPSQKGIQLVFNKPKVNIDFAILDSDQFKNLAPFPQMELQFTYDATTSQGKDTQGLISAVSSDEARQILESMDLVVVDIEEVKIGRDNPFAPYLQSSAPTTGGTTTKTTTTPAKTTTK